MASMEIDIRDEEPSVLVFSGSSTFELVLGSVSVTMTMEQFDKLCEQMRAWIVEDSPAHTSEARDAAAKFVERVESVASFLVGYGEAAEVAASGLRGALFDYDAAMRQEAE